jgi:hypothetical protein
LVVIELCDSHCVSPLSVEEDEAIGVNRG